MAAAKPVKHSHPELTPESREVQVLRALRRHEQALTASVRELLRQHGRTDLAEQVAQSQNALESVAGATTGYPSPLLAQNLGEQRRSINTLIDRLTRQNTFSLELVIPTRAILSHALGMARLNFFRMLRHVLEQLPENGADGMADLHRSVEDGIAECIGMRAAEEILRNILCRDEAGHTVRERAALMLLRVWDGASSHGTEELIPVLSAVWQARRRARVVLGTLVGASELFSLLSAGCDPQFLEFLTKDDCSEDQVAAFREFLFGISHEELTELQQQNEGKILSLDTIRATLSDEMQLGIYQAGDEAERFFLFFMKRHLLATYRAEMNLPGPKQTAEQYVLTHMLAEQWEALGG